MENKITSGIWFVFIGLVLLLHNLEVIDFNFWATIKYWPLLIIILGINLIAQNKAYGNYIKIGCNVLFLGWVLYVGISAPATNWTEQLFNRRNIEVGDIDSSESMSNEVHTAFDPAVKESTFEFNGGAGKFEMKAQESAHLISARAKTDDMGLNIQTRKTTDNKQKVTINAKPVSGGKQSNTVIVDINPHVLWNLNLNYGAASINGDLATLQFQKLELNAGASHVSLTLGSPQIGVSKIDISTGASTIHLRIPKDAAIKAAYTTILSKNSFEGFESNEKGVAKTANYEVAENKFDIELQGAANTFKITRY